MKEKTKTELMAEELRAADAVMAILDQSACLMGCGLPRLFAEQCRAVEKLRDQELRDWNEIASCGLHDVRRMLYRCDNAAAPYHDVTTEEDCDIYTPNYEVPPIPGTVVHICDTCNERAADRAEKSADRATR